MEIEGQPAQPSDPGWELQEEEERGHSQEESSKSSIARAATRVMDPGLQLGSPSVRKGSGESCPEPSEKERRQKRKNDKNPRIERDTQMKRRQSKIN